MEYKKIIYPSTFNKNLGIGVTAPSSGLGSELFIKRFELVAKQLTNKGFKIIEGNCLRKNYKHVSDTQQKRAEDFINLWTNPDVGSIIPPWGGEILIDILDLIDYKSLVNNPAKWLLGYSDISTLLFPITLITGIATAHGINFMDMIDTQTDPLSQNALNILKIEPGESFEQESSERHQIKFVNFNNNIEAAYNLTEKTEWKSLNKLKDSSITGRLIGGCLDILGNLVGTPYGNIKYFKDTFKKDGVIIYLENCALSPCELTRTLRQMRLANWFDNVNGVIFGRTTAKNVEDPNDLSYVEALQQCFDGLNFPVIYDADIGHKPPNMTLINGAIAKLSLNDGKAKLVQYLK